MTDLLELLKDAPKDAVFYCDLIGPCYITEIEDDEYDFVISSLDKNWSTSLTRYGTYFSFEDCPEANCILWPSKNCRSWENFKASWEDGHKKFKPMEPVLVPYYCSAKDKELKKWILGIYSHWDSDSKMHRLILGGYYDFEVLPYEGNEDKLGKAINTWIENLNDTTNNK